MASAFHCFAQLPFELRQLVWELSIEPRRVCAESRHHTQRYYTKAFVSNSAPYYTWVNFDIDTVCIHDEAFPDFHAELALIKHLALEIPEDDEFFVQLVAVEGYVSNCGMLVIDEMPLLENLEFPMHLGDIEQWVGYMYNCNDPNHEPREINKDNYCKVARNIERKRWLEHPDWYVAGYVMSDDDSDDPDSPS